MRFSGCRKNRNQNRDYGPVKISTSFSKKIIKFDYQAEVKNHIEHCLHRYKLCCMCYVLLCDDTFVRFDQKYGIIACMHPCPVLDQLYDVTAHGYINTSMRAPKLSKLLHPFPDEPELPWIGLYRNCRYIPDCVNLYNNNTTWSILNHTYQGPVNGENKKWCTYTRDEFLLAVGALSDYVKDTKCVLPKELLTDAKIKQKLSLTQTKNITEAKPISVSELPRPVILENSQLKNLRKFVIRPTVYNIKVFQNVNKEDDGLMEYFDVSKLLKPDEIVTSTANETASTTDDDESQHITPQSITFFETKIILDYDYAKKKNISIEELQDCYKTEQATSEIITTNNNKWFEDTKKHAIHSWKLVNFCRFVFARFNNPAVNSEITGILFFTDNHYGHTLVEFDQQHKRKLCKNCKRKFPDGNHPNTKKVFLCDLCRPCQLGLR